MTENEERELREKFEEWISGVKPYSQFHLWDAFKSGYLARSEREAVWEGEVTCFGRIIGTASTMNTDQQKVRKVGLVTLPTLPEEAIGEVHITVSRVREKEEGR